jgi:thiosulfate/3-mercaptopyruvate sulfurtransferase
MRHSTLVDTLVLAAHLEDPDWVVFDCRHDLARPEAGASDYQAGHIPGAFFVHLDRDLAGTHTGHNGRHPLPDRKMLAEKLGRAGLTPGAQLVAYDAQGGMCAARLWWLARWLGHTNAAVLDGGWQQWIAERRPASPEVPQSRASRFQEKPGVQSVSATYVMEKLAGITLIDARSPDRFRGENETLDPVGGRIPGARNRFFRENLDANGKFKTAQTLKREFNVLLSGSAIDDVVHSCGSGVSACHNLLAMEIAGLQGSRLYPGSWSEWCADPARPVAKGEA